LYRKGDHGIYKKKEDIYNKDYIKPTDKVEKVLFREGEAQDLNQKAVKFTHWNSGTIYSGVIESNFLLLNERHCRVFVPGQKKPFTVKLNELEFKG
jgi:hypothetical protein